MEDEEDEDGQQWTPSDGKSSYDLFLQICSFYTGIHYNKTYFKGIVEFIFYEM